MKKTILSIAIVGLMATASTSWAYANPTAGPEDLVQTDAAKSNDGIPVVANADATKSLTEFKALVEKYGPGLASKDTAATAEFGNKIQTWAQSVPGWMAKLTPEEQQKVGAYMQGLMQKYMPQPAAPAAAPAATPK